MLVIDGSVRWGPRGALPALVPMLSVLGGLWAGVHLGRLWTVLPVALREASHRDAEQRVARRRVRQVVVGAVIRLVATVVILSLALLFGPWGRGAPEGLLPWLLSGFGLVALATLTVTLNESFGRAGWAVLAVTLGLTAEATLRAALPYAVAESGLLLGAFVVVAVLLPPTLALLREPARTLATVVNVR